MKTAYVVESPALRSDGQYSGTFRLYVATEERAKEIAAQHPERSYRPIPFEEMPEVARLNLEKALAEEGNV